MIIGFFEIDSQIFGILVSEFLRNYRVDFASELWYNFD